MGIAMQQHIPFDLVVEAGEGGGIGLGDGDPR